MCILLSICHVFSVSLSQRVKASQWQGHKKSTKSNKVCIKTINASVIILLDNVDFIFQHVRTDYQFSQVKEIKKNVWIWWVVEVHWNLGHILTLISLLPVCTCVCINI